MNISIIAFAVMAVVTIVFLAAIVLVEWNSTFQTKTPRRDSPIIRDSFHTTVVMEYPRLQPGQSPKPGAESFIPNS